MDVSRCSPDEGLGHPASALAEADDVLQQLAQCVTTAERRWLLVGIFERRDNVALREMRITHDYEVKEERLFSNIRALERKAERLEAEVDRLRPLADRWQEHLATIKHSGRVE